MSNYVFPMVLPGVGLHLTREASHGVIVQESVGGRELRSTWRTQPRNRYRLAIDFLRSTSDLRELQHALNFFSRHFGMLDSFLLDDPEDNSVSGMTESIGGHGFGRGDGVTAGFQLQRSLKSAVYDRSGGPWSSRTRNRSNSAPYSQDFANAAWTKTNTGSPTACMAPDGTATGASYTSTGTATIVGTSYAISAGSSHTFSVFARCAAGATLKIGTTEGNSAAFTLGASWTRVYVVFTAAGASTVLTIGADSSWGTGVTLELWGAQLEPTVAPYNYTEPMTTTSTFAVAYPKFWPQVGDGFEPVYDIKTSPPPAIYKGSVLKAITTDYTVSATGLVTFVAVPGVDVIVSWTGGFYKRVRFANPGLSVERIVQSMWKAGGVELVSVIP